MSDCPSLLPLGACTLTIPLMYYRAATLPIQKGALKVAFTADATLDPVTGKTISATAVNTMSAAL